MGLFGTSGIRGDAEKLFTDQFSFDLGRTFSIFLNGHDQNGPVAIGMDPRSSSPRIKKAFISGLTAGGREVFDEGITPVPAIHYITKKTNIIASAMISGSHIVGTMNGIKFFAFGDEILKDHEVEIEKIYGSEKEKVLHEEVRGIKEESRANDLYVDMLIGQASLPYPKWKIVIDPGNGSQAIVMPKVFKRLGFEPVLINTNIQEKFVARDTEAGTGFEELQDAVKKEKADFGIAWDADGDRCVFVDENGDYVPGDYASSLMARHLDTPVIVVTFNASQVVEKLGKPVVRVKVGSPFVVEAMKKHGATFGFEANGGGIFANVMLSRDGGTTAITMLNILKKSGKSLRSTLDELPKFYIFRTKVDYPPELKDEIIKRAKREFNGIKTEDLDGLKIWPTSDSWILFRSSSNAPEFRVFVEAPTEVEAEDLGKRGIEFVKSVIA